MAGRGAALRDVEEMECPPSLGLDCQIWGEQLVFFCAVQGVVLYPSLVVWEKVGSRVVGHVDFIRIGPCQRARYVCGKIR